MQKILFILGVILLLNLNMVYSHEHNREEAKALIDSKASCDELSDEQLEMIGEYYMEQMHPGEAHELMDKMMGGEGSESLKQMHIQMARVLYCGEPGGMMGSGGMMGMMSMMNMMDGGNMMGGQNPAQTNMMQGMMGNLGYSSGYWNIINILYIILLVGLIILVYLWIIKLLRNMKNKRGKK